MKVSRLAHEKLFEPDITLAIALFTGFIFCVYGITSKMSHPDQMVFLPIFHEGKLPFNPGWFEKPPFHTYFSYFLSILPISILGTLLGVAPDSIEFAQKIWSRLLTAFLFLGSIVILFYILKKSFGIFSARFVTLIFATSAGLIAHSHFLTADIPVMFWMLVAFYFSHAILFERKTSYYLFAGLFTGIATATKYNGLAIGVALVAAHILSVGPTFRKTVAYRQLLFSKRLLLGLVMVGVGFMVANPFSLLDYYTFIYDFIHNYLVAPVYEGQIGSSYGTFFLAMIELIGLPSVSIFSVAILFSVYSAVFGKTQRIAQATILLSLSVFLIYYIKFAPFPRLETRFVLPIVPFWLVISGLFWDNLKAYSRVVIVLLAGILGYNLVSSFYVGARFLDDPRMRAEIWVKENIANHSSVEVDIYSSSWNEVPGVEVRETTSPFVTGRERLFEQLFAGNRFVVGSDDHKREVDEMVEWYSLRNLFRRKPDFVVADSRYYQRFTKPGLRRDLYPSMAAFYQALFSEQNSYEIVYDDESKPVPSWIYPQDIDFLHHRITIFARKEPIFSESQ